MFESVCNICNCVSSACSHTDCSVDTCTLSVIKNWQDGTMRRTCVKEPMMSSPYKHNGNSKVSIENDKPLIHRNTNCAAGVKASQIQCNVAGNALHLSLPNKDLNVCHWNIQGVSGKDMCKFSEIKAILTVNKNVHILGLSDTKLKEHKLTSMFQVEGYQYPFERITILMVVGGSWYTLEKILMLNVEKI